MRPRTHHRRHRNQQRLFLILGLLVIAVVAVGGEISFRALSGLPFQSHYDVAVALPNADRLIATDDVRVGGVRVGEVTAVTAEPGVAGHSPYAVVRLQIDPALGRLPVNTRVEVRPASVLGATYVALTLGTARRTVPPGGMLPLSQAVSSVDVTSFFQIFKGSAAKNFQSSTADFAAGLGGEGENFNATVGSLAALMTPLTVVSQALASPSAHLSGFISATDRAFSALSPVSAQLGGLVVGAARTFGAVTDQLPSLAATIEDAPGAETSGTVALKSALPGLRDFASLMRALAPATPELIPGLVTLNGAFSAGTRPFIDLPPFARSLRGALTALDQISRLASTTGALRKLAQMTVAGSEAIAPFETAQLHCNIFPLFTIGQSSFLGALGTGEGPSLSNTAIDNPGNSTDNQQSAAPPADGHINYRPVENGSECAANNEPYSASNRVLTNPSGLPDDTRATSPPPGVLARARSVGLLAQP